jgi:hypothetical protein
MQVICEFVNSNVIIEIVDNPVVQDWLLNSDFTGNWTSSWHYPTATDYDTFKKEVYRKNLIKTIEQFNNVFTDLQFPFQVDANTKFTNDDLNTIHRFFTTAVSHRSWYFHNPSFRLTDVDKWYELLGPINFAVHDLQIFYPNQRKAEFKETTVIEIKADHIQEYMHKIGDWKYLDYHLECDVFIQHVICGKDAFQAYIDHDNCKHADITPQWNSIYGSFYIDVNGSRNQHMKTKDFVGWLEGGRKLNTAWQYMPLGKIITGPIVPAELGDLIRIKLQ